MLNKFLGLSIILTILVSGCIGTQTSVTTGNGIIIEEFEPEFSQVYSEEPVYFRLKMKNIGSVKAESVHAELLGIDKDWNQGEEMLPIEKECQHTGEGFSLLPPTPDIGVEGESHVCTWKYTAPTLPQGLSMTYAPTARVFYKYNSEVIKSITIVPRAQWKILKDQGKPLPTETMSSTNAPISLDIETHGPIPSWSETVTFPLAIKIDNIGGGIVCSGNPSNGCKLTNENWNKLKLKIIPKTAGVTVSNCNKYVQKLGEISLWKGRSNTITCKITVTGLKTTSSTQVLINVHAEYTYLIDEATSITVTSRFE
jgi:hypothetical protein